MNPVEFLTHFVGRWDAYAVQNGDGSYTKVDDRLTHDHLRAHLAGEISIGAYVINPESQSVRFICWDLDTNDFSARLDLKQAVNEAAVAGIPGGYQIIWEFSGRKGYHGWLLLNEPTPASVALDWVNQYFHYDQPIEIFPKQDEVQPGGYGNLVKLPFGVHRVSGKRSCIYHPDTGAVLHYSPTLTIDWLSKNTLGAAHARPKVQRLRYSPDGNDDPVSIFPCITRILREGVGSGYRDNAIFHLAAYYYGHGLDFDLAMAQCMRANEKFQPPLTEREVERRVRSAYSGRYHAATCGTGWLRDICPGGCRSGLTPGRPPASVGYIEVGSTLPVTVEAVTVDRVTKQRKVRITMEGAINKPTIILEGNH